MAKDGDREWVTFEDFSYDDDDFLEVGLAFEASIGYTPGLVGFAPSKLLEVRPLVDFAVTWFQTHRKYEKADQSTE